MDSRQVANPAVPEQAWLSLPDAAAQLGMSSLALRRWIKDDRIQSDWVCEDGSRELQVLVDSRLNNATHQDAQVNEPSSIIGRTGEMAQLITVLEAASVGRGLLVVVGGDAGIGKTTLVEAAAAIATNSGFTVLTGHCYDVEHAPMYGPWREAVAGAAADSSVEDVPVFIANTEASPPAGGAMDLHFSVEKYLRHLSGNAPLLLVFEDIHWADRSSLDLLRYMARRVADQMIAIVVTYRDVDLLPDQPLYLVLPQLIRETPIVRIGLRPLTEDDVHSILGQRYALEPDDAARLGAYIWRYAEGNPFFTDELALHLEHAGVLEMNDGRWSLGDLPGFRVPPLIQQVIAHRLDRVSASSIQLLRVASVIGVEVPIDLWQQVSGAGDDELAACIDEALQSRIISELPHRNSVRFRHALIRESLYDSLQIIRRREQHLRVATVMAAGTNPEPSLVAHHFLLANDELAVDWLIRAGRAAALSFMYQPATEHFRQAMEILEGHPERAETRAWLACELAAAYRYTDPELAFDWINAATRYVEVRDDPALNVVIPWVRSHIRGFMNENGLPELQQAAAALNSLSESDSARIQETSLALIVSRGMLTQRLAYYARYEDARKSGENVLSHARPPVSTRDHQDHGTAHLGLAIAYANLGRPDEARASFAAARDHLNQTSHHFLVGSAYTREYRHVIEAYMPERVEVRRQMIDAASDRYRRSIVTVLSGNQHHLTLLRALLLEGRWDEARDTAEKLVDGKYLHVECAETLAELDWLQGNYERAWKWIDSSIPEGASVEPASTRFHEIVGLQRIAANVALDQHQPELALAWIKALQRWLAWSDTVLGRYAPPLLMSRYKQVTCDPAAALEHARHAARHAQQPRQPLGLLQAERLLGSLTERSGEPERAGQHLGIALDLARSIHAPYEIALSEIAYARHLVGQRQSDQAAQLLSSARAALESLGAAPALAEVDDIDGLLGQVEPAGTKTFGLSPREIEVLCLVAKGLTDAAIGEELFISRRTVSGHVQSIFNKCGVTSRAAATAFAYEHHIIEPGT